MFESYIMHNQDYYCIKNMCVLSKVSYNIGLVDTLFGIQLYGWLEITGIFCYFCKKFVSCYTVRCPNT